MPTRYMTFAMAALLAILFASGELRAAPQILALVETGGPTPLVCEGGQCSGEFSGFCLQKERPDPKPGTRYRAEGGDLTLVVTDAAGTVRRIPAADYLEIATRRSYTAVRISLRESVMRDLGAVSVALEIGERVALVPVAQAGDMDPQTEADIALALGPQRALGERVLRQSPAESGAVALTNRMLNALPKGRTDDDTRNGLWDRAIDPFGGAYPAGSVTRAERIYRRCMAKVENGDFYTLRDCLEVGHDALMLDLNRKYWEAGPES